MMLELKRRRTMPPQCLSRMRPQLESPELFALTRDDGSGIASAWTPSRRQRRTPWMAVWKREAETDGEAYGHVLEDCSRSASVLYWRCSGGGASKTMRSQAEPGYEKKQSSDVASVARQFLCANQCYVCRRSATEHFVIGRVPGVSQVRACGRGLLHPRLGACHRSAIQCGSAESGERSCATAITSRGSCVLLADAGPWGDVEALIRRGGGIFCGCV